MSLGDGEHRRNDSNRRGHRLVIDRGPAAARAGCGARGKDGSCLPAGERSVGGIIRAEGAAERDRGPVGNAESGAAARIVREVGSQRRGTAGIDLSGVGADTQHQPGIEGRSPAPSRENAVAAGVARASVATPPVVGEGAGGAASMEAPVPPLGATLPTKRELETCDRANRLGENSAAGPSGICDRVSGKG